MNKCSSPKETCRDFGRVALSVIVLAVFAGCATGYQTLTSQEEINFQNLAVQKSLVKGVHQNGDAHFFRPLEDQDSILLVSVEGFERSGRYSALEPYESSVILSNYREFYVMDEGDSRLGPLGLVLCLAGGLTIAVLFLTQI